MGQKVNPKSLRLVQKKQWDSLWFAGDAPAVFLAEDEKIREIIGRKLPQGAAIEKIEIKRSVNRVETTIYTARPGLVIGRSGQGINDLSEFLLRKIGKPIKIEVMEIKKPDLSAGLVAENIAHQLERRVQYRKAVKQSLEKVMQAGAKGVKIVVAGRLGGAEIARREKFTKGAVPLATLRAEIDFASRTALTTYGTIGIKVWIYVNT